MEKSTIILTRDMRTVTGFWDNSPDDSLDADALSAMQLYPNIQDAKIVEIITEPERAVKISFVKINKEMDWDFGTYLSSKGFCEKK